MPEGLKFIREAFDQITPPRTSESSPISILQYNGASVAPIKCRKYIKKDILPGWLHNYRGQFESNMERIDVHSHAIPPKYRQHLIENGHQNPDGMPAIPAWSAEDHIAMMKDLNIKTSILSISSPGTNLKPSDPAACIEMTRSANEELSAICAAHPSYFKFFASLPLASVPDSLKEIDYALNKLDAAGFVLLSNTNGVYLGDRVLDPVMAKLNERKAVLFMHPTACNIFPSQGSAGIQVVKPLQRFPHPLMEFMFDKTRAVSNLLFSGTVANYPDIKFIMSHCGCALPPLVDRMVWFAPLAGAREVESGTFKSLLRERFFFDLAGLPFPDQIHGLLRTLGEDGWKRLLYGSDHCFTPAKMVASMAIVMDEGCLELFGVDGRKAVYSGNAEKLFAIAAKM